LAVGTSIALDLPHVFVLATAVVAALILPIPWLFFVFEYTGQKELTSLSVAGLTAILPGIGLLATAVISGSQLVPWLSLPSQETAGGLVAVGVIFLGMVQWLALLYAGGLMLIGSGLLLGIFRRYKHLNPTTGMLLGIFGTVPWLSLLFGFQVASLDPFALSSTVAIGFLVGGIAATTALGRYDLFRTVPAAGNVGPATVIEELEDMVVVTNGAGTVVEINAAAERILGTTEAEVVGADVGELLDAPLFDTRQTGPVELHSETGRMLFEPTISELTDQHGHLLGYVIVLRDVTARTTRQQRLEVLNRVLRHNLNNEMNTILGRAELLRQSVTEPDLADNTDAILRAGRSLTRLSAEAREIEQVMAITEPATQDIPLAPLAQNVVEAVTADQQQVTCACDVPADVIVTGFPDLLKLALTKLVENAIEHNDGEEPYVGLRARFEPDQKYPLQVSVVDNGPGIPTNEAQAVEQGAESPLQHGTGLGLWVVQWAATRMGGDIDFNHRDTHGTIASLRLPRARRGTISEVSAPIDPNE
jgi:PAS domain S-box-containing protein